LNGIQQVADMSDGHNTCSGLTCFFLCPAACYGFVQGPAVAFVAGVRQEDGMDTELGSFFDASGCVWHCAHGTGQADFAKETAFGIKDKISVTGY
jgi:hypothetical protein